MKKLAIAAIVAAVLAIVTSGAALWRTRDLSKSSKATTESTEAPSTGAPSTTPDGLVDVPDATNKPALAMGKALSDAQLKYKVVRTPSTTVARSNVISQNPAPGTKVPPGTTVELTVSSGP